MTETLSITDLSREFDVTTRAIRFYEDEGLLHPVRRGRQRVYTNRDRVRLKLILRGKRLGFTLSEIAEIINLYHSEPGETAQLDHFIDKIRERRRLLLQQKEDIEITLAELEAVEKQCRERLGRLRRKGDGAIKN
ncbi:MAG: MerR family DNA-binding transcriptional regulator [Gammaproteobacteria bacterium]|nr:MerR family DNA-binding transcriptional regulator [Gammaproteobacteria bacterium]